MKTIAFYIKEPFKVNQGFMYYQTVMLKQYRYIVIGPYPNSENVLYPFNEYYNLNDIKDLGTFFKENNVVAIHAHQGKHSLKILPIATKYNIPLIVHFRGRDSSTQTEERYSENLKRYQQLKQQGSGYFAVCQFLAEELKKLGFPEENIHVLYGGLDLSLYPYQVREMPTDGVIKILSVARLVEKKGFFTLLRAFQLIQHEYPRATLHIIGSGQDEEKIRTYIKNQRLNDRVFLRGSMSSKEIAEELKQAHLFCLASETGEDGDVEGIPNSLKEAMASGVPVVSTFHGGIPELIQHEKSGYLAPEKSERDLANGLKFFLDHPEKWKSFTDQARQTIDEKFDIAKQIFEQERLYELIESKKMENKKRK